jgi:plastocyanin
VYQGIDGDRKETAMRLHRTLLATMLPVALLGPALLWSGPAVAGGVCHSETVSEAEGQTVAMRDNCFSPMVLHAKPGEIVTFVNRDGAPHTVTGSGGWGTGFTEMRPGMTFRVRLEERGLYLFDCVVHPGMVGAISVGGGKTIRVADSRSVIVAPEASTEETASGASGSTEGLAAETASAEEASTAGAGALALVGVGALGAGYGLGRVRRRTADREG